MTDPLQLFRELASQPAASEDIKLAQVEELCRRAMPVMVYSEADEIQEMLVKAGKLARGHSPMLMVFCFQTVIEQLLRTLPDDPTTPVIYRVVCEFARQLAGDIQAGRA